MYVVRQWVDFSLAMAAGILGLLIVKDFAIYPLVRGAYATDARHGTDLLLGLQGVATEPILTCGYVRVRGELWRAESAGGTEEIASGSVVVVESARGLTLIVRPTPSYPETPSSGKAIQ